MLKNAVIPWAQSKPRDFIIVFSIIIILLYQCYSPNTIGNAFLFKLLNTVVVIWMLIYTYKQWMFPKKGLPLYNILRWMLFSICITMVPALVIKDQSIPLSFTVLARCELVILVFFLLWKWQPDVHSLENVILIFGVLYIVLWLYAFTQLPTMVFGYVAEDSDYLSADRGIVRINFIGRGNVIMAFFLSLNRYKNNKKIKWLLLAIFFFVFNVLQVTRQLIVWPLLVALIYMLWRNKKLVIASILCVGLWSIFSPKIKMSEDSLIGSMVNITQNQFEKSEGGEEDVRVKEYQYFFTKWHDDFITMLFGTSQPNGNSAFGEWYYYKLIPQKQIILADVGYGSMFAKQGLLGLILYACFFITAIKMKVPKERMYTKLWFYFMIFANIAASWYYMADFVVCSAICAYVLIKAKQESMVRPNI